MRFEDFSSVSNEQIFQPDSRTGNPKRYMSYWSTDICMEANITIAITSLPNITTAITKNVNSPQNEPVIVLPGGHATFGTLDFREKEEGQE